MTLPSTSTKETTDSEERLQTESIMIEEGGKFKNEYFHGIGYVHVCPNED